MEPLHARYPFLRSAREAVAAAEVDLAEVVTGEQAVVERAMERIEGALEDGRIGEQHRRVRVEVLSYPVARVLVSLVDEHVLTRKYARAEAATAHERFEADRQGTALKSSRRQRLGLDEKTPDEWREENDVEDEIYELLQSYHNSND